MNPKRTYYKNGQIESEQWRNGAGDHHKLDGPAYRWWYDGGRLQFEEWCVNGKTHRLDGPAYQGWYRNGRLSGVEYWINGVKYKTKNEFLIAVDLYKANEIAELF